VTPFGGRLVHKRVESRTWGRTHRGPLLIHAGKSRRWLDSWDWPMPEGLVYGALIGVVDLIACCWLEYLDGLFEPRSG
jgi:hypothetical protein